jgi:predicted kinase
MPRIYILCGLAFSGKTTLAKTLVQRLGLARVSIDEINSARGVGLDNAWISPENWDLTYAESYRQLDEYLRAGRSVLYDAGNFNRAERDKARAIAAQSGAGALVIYVTTPETTTRERWQRNRLTHERNDIRDDYFEIGAQMFEPPAADENVLLYSNEQNVDAWIEENGDAFPAAQEGSNTP